MKITQTVRLFAARDNHRNKVGDSGRRRVDVSEDDGRGNGKEGV